MHTDIHIAANADLFLALGAPEIKLRMAPKSQALRSNVLLILTMPNDVRVTAKGVSV